MERYQNNIDHLDARYILDYDVLKEINKKRFKEERRKKKLRKVLDALKKKNAT